MKEEDGSTTILYKDGTFENKKFGGQIDQSTLQSYAKAIESGAMQINQLPQNLQNQVIGMVDFAKLPKQMSEEQKMALAHQYDLEKMGYGADIDMAKAEYERQTGKSLTKIDDGLFEDKNGNIYTKKDLVNATKQRATQGTDLSQNQDFVQMASNNNEASVKNNNPAGISFPISKSLQDRMTAEGIQFSQGSARPKAEGGSYIKFATAEDGLNAMRLLWTISGEKNQTIGSRLGNWAVAGYTLPDVDMNKKFTELSKSEQDDLLIKQMKHEAPVMYKALSSTGIISSDGYINSELQKQQDQQTGLTPSDEALIDKYLTDPSNEKVASALEER